MSESPGKGQMTYLTLHILLLLLSSNPKMLDTLFDPNWVNAMHEELENFEIN